MNFRRWKQNVGVKRATKKMRAAASEDNITKVQPSVRRASTAAHDRGADSANIVTPGVAERDRKPEQVNKQR